jgi:hypothetical protein
MWGLFFYVVSWLYLHHAAHRRMGVPHDREGLQACESDRRRLYCLRDICIGMCC